MILFLLLHQFHPKQIPSQTNLASFTRVYHMHLFTYVPLVYPCLSSLTVLHPPWTWATWLLGEKAVASGGGSAPRAARRSRSDGTAPPGEVTYECAKGRIDNKVCWWWPLFFGAQQNAMKSLASPSPRAFRCFAGSSSGEFSPSESSAVAASASRLSSVLSPASSHGASWVTTKQPQQQISNANFRWNATNSDTEAEWPQKSWHSNF